MRREPQRIGPQERLLLLKCLPIAERAAGGGLRAAGPARRRTAVRRRRHGGSARATSCRRCFSSPRAGSQVERVDRPATSIGRGDVAGALEVMAHAPSAATIRAAADTLLLEIPADTLFDVYEDHFGIFMATVRNIAEALLDGDTALPGPRRSRPARGGAAARSRRPRAAPSLAAGEYALQAQPARIAGPIRGGAGDRDGGAREPGCGRGATARRGFCFSSGERLPAPSRARSTSSKGPASTSARWNRWHKASGASTPTSAKRWSAFGSALNGSPICSRTTSRWRKTCSPSSPAGCCAPRSRPALSTRRCLERPSRSRRAATADECGVSRLRQRTVRQFRSVWI